MFNSLLSWCKFPVNVHKFAGRLPSGDNKYEEPVEKNGYRVDGAELITDKHGQEYISKSRVYFPPSVDVSEDDMISFEGVQQYEIRRLGGYYDGNDGKLSIRVVWL